MKLLSSEGRKGLLHGEEQPSDVDAEEFVEVCLGNFPQCRVYSHASVGKKHIDVSMMLFNSGIETLEVCELGDITLNTSDILPDLLYCCIQFALTATGDIHMRAF